MTNKELSEGKRASTFVYWNELMEKAPPNAYRELFEAEKAYLQRVVKPYARVLDIGCGNGRSLSYLLDEGRTRFLQGIDNDPEAVAAARKRFEGEYVGIYHEDILDCEPFSPQYNNILCMGNTLGNFGQDKDALLSVMYELSDPFRIHFLGCDKSKEVIVGVYNEDAFDERMKHYRDLGGDAISRIEGTTVYVNHPGGELVSEQFTREQLTDLFSRHGFAPIEIVKQGIGYFGRFKRNG